MKKLLTILGIISISSISAFSVVSCVTNSEESNDEEIHPEFARLLKMSEDEIFEELLALLEWAEQNPDDEIILNKILDSVSNGDKKLPNDVTLEQFVKFYDIILKSFSLTAISTKDPRVLISLKIDIDKGLAHNFVSEDQILWLINLKNYSEKKISTLEPIQPKPEEPKKLHPEFEKLVSMNETELQEEYDALLAWVNKHSLNQEVLQEVLKNVLNNEQQLPKDLPLETFLDFYNKGLKWYTLTVIRSIDPAIIESLQNDLKKHLTSIFIGEEEILWLNNLNEYIEEKLANLEPLPPKELHPEFQKILELDEEEFNEKYQELTAWYNAPENQQNIRWIFLIIESHLESQELLTEEEFNEYYPIYLDYFIYALIAISDREIIYDYLEHLQEHLENKLVSDDKKALINDVVTYIVDQLMAGEK